MLGEESKSVDLQYALNYRAENTYKHEVFYVSMVDTKQKPTVDTHALQENIKLPWKRVRDKEINDKTAREQLCTGKSISINNYKYK